MTVQVSIAIDRGGTFTDVIYKVDSVEKTFKLLSVDPDNYDDSNIEGIRRVLEEVTGSTIPRGELLDTSIISSIRLGTTVATNALLERKGVSCALITTKGFKDLLHIADQSRPDLFALNIVKPGVLQDHVVEVDERVTMPAFTVDPTGYDAKDLVDGEKYVLGETNEVFEIVKPLDTEKLEKDLRHLKETTDVDSVAIVFVHGFNFQKHEKLAGEIARKVGFSNVSLSHEILPVLKMVPRGQSTVVDAYLTPIVKTYVAQFLKGLRPDFDQFTRIEFMQSDGGLCSWENFSGLKSLLSGPAGGVVGEAKTCYDKMPIIGFDMGGTSTDVSRYDGQYEFSFENIVAGIKLAAPQLDINTVAAGGGSILSYKNGVFAVGPESASAHPGPACYRKGGPLTITDANLFTGRILPEFFPNIFGPNEDQPLDIEITRSKFEELANIINKENNMNKTPEEIALGFLKVANFQMAKPIRELTDAKGHDIRKHALASFGGAGGQHATSIAKVLKINKVLIHKHSSILSAYGISLADLVNEEQEPVSAVYTESSRDDLIAKAKSLYIKSQSSLQEQGAKSDTIKTTLFFNMGYKGSDTRIMVSQPENNDFLSVFYETHEREFAFNDFEKDVLISDIRVRSEGNAEGVAAKEYSPFDDIETHPVDVSLSKKSTKIIFDEGTLDSAVYFLNDLSIGSTIQGPSVILDATQTILVTPDSTATIHPRHVVLDVNVSTEKVDVSTTVVDPIQLAIFANRFMSIADEMSRTLQKISVSANIKERMDYSCALFDNQGNLCANAPNVPVHLGSMSSAIKYQLDHWKGNLKEGDILCTNSPSVGGTHLPDLTIVSPVFHEGEIQFVVASRAHHSEIGGSAPGSSSSYAREIYEEGVNIETWKIVDNGKFDYEGLKHHFTDVPKTHGVSGTRNIDDNVSDLKAQIASNQRGINLLKELFNEYGSETVLFYMRNVKKTAAMAVEGYLREFAKKNAHRLPLTAEDYMDDGTKICCKIDIDGEEGKCVIDFTGTSLESYSNLNSPKSVTFSAVIYVLRCLVDMDIPLNQGCLDPVEVIIPENTLINPSPYAAVCAGNGMTSQRITDCLLKAFGVTSATGGCMNGLNFGTGGENEKGEMIKGFGYTETIGQGNCAGIIEKNGERVGFHGFSGTQTNMTNTKITDPEVLELRYPCFLIQYTIREGSGGKGKFCGGNGLIREIQFNSPVHLSLVTQRRVFSPWGIYGGDDGKRGENYLGRNRGNGVIQWIQLPSLAEIKMRKGDILKVMTPGGGGFGKETDSDEFWGLTEGTKKSKYLPLSAGSVGLMKDNSDASQ
ncbi:CYFA0S20e01728g1_1 [Cyberlindnera fabianii]|uniref:CYFA0S20e01728g1_1 n=1 Tax=Cyberlindnera fabianii TaxID=36022 RepID=A0A061BG15_CYBFA|nr:CYFA0S20e01728g1_1 [Cyberlindnera fabianii]